MIHIGITTIVSCKGASQIASRVKDRLNSTLSVEKIQPGILPLAESRKGERKDPTYASNNTP
jgi:hypothetical protein